MILATRNRAALLGQTLKHMSKLDTAGINWELLVVDNDSSDETSAVLEAARRDLPLCALHESLPGKNRALNRALVHARGELLVFTDDDVIPGRSWLTELIGAAGRWPTDAIFGGPIDLRYPAGTPAWVVSLRHVHFPDYRVGQEEGPTDRPPVGPNCAIRASALDGMRFCETIGPDGSASFAMGSETELLLRLMGQGRRVIYVPGAVLEHLIQPYQLGGGYLKGRSFRLGRGHVRKQQAYHWGRAHALGVPLFVWRHLLEAGLRYAAGSLFGRRRRLQAALDFHYFRGCVVENRLIQAEGRGAVRHAEATRAPH